MKTILLPLLLLLACGQMLNPSKASNHKKVQITERSSRLLSSIDRSRCNDLEILSPGNPSEIQNASLGESAVGVILNGDDNTNTLFLRSRCTTRRSWIVFSACDPGAKQISFNKPFKVKELGEEDCCHQKLVMVTKK